MAKYRKRLGRYEPWHFFPGCPDWPVYGYIEQDEIPQEELCHKCIDASAESDPEATRAPRTRLARVPPVRVLFRKERHGDPWPPFPRASCGRDVITSSVPSFRPSGRCATNAGYGCFRGIESTT